MSKSRCRRRLPIGSEPLPGGGAHFRVWAPASSRVDVVLEPDAGSPSEVVGPLQREREGYFSGVVASARPGSLYRYRINGRSLPDPASRFQPQGCHGPSQIIDPDGFTWTDSAWPGVALDGQVMYELHVGTFTREGTWGAAERELRELRSIGVSVLELMPVAEFPGRFGWGYDGVDLFAPTRLYGTPDDFRHFVDAAHREGLGVILDVVYNHMGPDGNYLKEFSASYFTNRHENDWGEAINFDDEGSGPVREFFIGNAGYWIEEFHLDGLRLDATHAIHDRSPRHVLSAIADRVREAAAGRSTIVVAENESQRAELARPLSQGGYGLDGLWNDDFHHSARVALTGRAEAYYTDYRGGPQELISAVKRGYLFQGQRYSWQKRRRGTSTAGLKPSTFIIFIENHDQIANSRRGDRTHKLSHPGLHRAFTALLLLAPGTPLLFQGQEFSASSPFLYFADHAGDLAEQVRAGRAQFLAQFPSLSIDQAVGWVADPADPRTFERCKLDFGERTRHVEAYALHRDLIALRRQDPAFRAQRPGGVDGAVLSERALVLRFFSEVERGDRLLLLNLGSDVHLALAPEPLLAPSERSRWALLWSSEDRKYGGAGMPAVETGEGWHVPGNAAVVLGLVPE